jgi:hypothetical protein
VISPNHLGFACLPAQPPRRALRIVLIALILILGSPSRGVMAGQTSTPNERQHEKPYALIFGTVWSPDDQAAYGIKIKIRRERDSKARWELLSDHSGEFAQRVPAGKQDYVVWADLKGVSSEGGKSLHADEVKVHVESDERVDISVHLKL